MSLDLMTSYLILAVGFFASWWIAPRGSFLPLLLAWVSSFAGYTTGYFASQGRIVNVLCYGGIFTLIGLVAKGRSSRLRRVLALKAALAAIATWVMMGALVSDSLFGGKNWIFEWLQFSPSLTVAVLFMDAILVARWLTTLGLTSMGDEGTRKAMVLAGWFVAIGCVEFMRTGIASNDTDVWVMTTLNVTAAALLVYCHVYLSAVVLPGWLEARLPKERVPA